MNLFIPGAKDFIGSELDFFYDKPELINIELPFQMTTVELKLIVDKPIQE